MATLVALAARLRMSPKPSPDPLPDAGSSDCYLSGLQRLPQVLGRTECGLVSERPGFAGAPNRRRALASLRFHQKTAQGI